MKDMGVLMQNYEDNIYKILFRIEADPGAIIGYLSVKILATFISGYIMCLFDLTGYLCRFDYDFQIFVENKTGQCDCRWDTILSRDRTNEESFRYFYQLLREFLDEVGYDITPIKG